MFSASFPNAVRPGSAGQHVAPQRWASFRPPFGSHASASSALLLPVTQPRWGPGTARPGQSRCCHDEDGFSHHGAGADGYHHPDEDHSCWGRPANGEGPIQGHLGCEAASEQSYHCRALCARLARAGNAAFAERCCSFEWGGTATGIKRDAGGAGADQSGVMPATASSQSESSAMACVVQETLGEQKSQGSTCVYLSGTT
mmetsp:Transcript_26703/g.50175  ORF Transcript_26703/g.50175 Transcript_26703/m.50175 type:complete len:200 (+) Transcript_26703:936-1535(+)